MNPADKQFRERLNGTGPRALIEELYYLGLTRGVDKETGVFQFLGHGELFLSFSLR